ncbi:MAG: DNA primase [Candidatus Neomarinimicrobiota bacterium]
MAGISQDTIDHIRDTSEILDIVSDYVELRKRGKNFFGLCPFHSEKTPSFSVAPDKQIFHCFGCGVGGNAITFLMEYEKISFVEALQKLAERYGIDVQFRQDRASKEFFTHLYDIHSLAADLYRKNRKSEAGDRVRRYLEKERGLTPETLDRFSIGLAGKEWDALLSVAKKKGFPKDAMDRCGLFTKTDKGTFDRFRNRLMFPITNLSGRVVAFGGRDLSGESEAKYLNSPETPIYNKSEIIYGLAHTKEAVRKTGAMIVVEGYTDFLQLYQKNIQNVAATSGTALTEKHVNQIRKFTHITQIAFDGDAAGRKAAIAAGYHLLRGGLTAEIVEIPDGSDPDGWVKEKGPKPFLAAVKKTKGLIQFHLANSGLDLSKPANRSRLAREIAFEISGIRDDIIRQHTIKILAEELAVDEEVLLRITTSRTRRHRRKEPETLEEDSSLFSSYERAQMELVKLLATGDQTTTRFLKAHLNMELFSHPVMKSLATYLLQTPDPSGALGQFEEKPDRDLASRILFETSQQEDSSRVAVDCLISLEESPLKRKITEERLKLRELERKGKDSSPALQSVMDLQKKLDDLETKRTELLGHLS